MRTFQAEIKLAGMAVSVEIDHGFFLKMLLHCGAEAKKFSELFPHHGDVSEGEGCQLGNLKLCVQHDGSVYLQICASKPYNSQDDMTWDERLRAWQAIFPGIQDIDGMSESSDIVSSYDCSEQTEPAEPVKPAAQIIGPAAYSQDEQALMSMGLSPYDTGLLPR